MHGSMLLVLKHYTEQVNNLMGLEWEQEHVQIKNKDLVNQEGGDSYIALLWSHLLSAE